MANLISHASKIKINNVINGIYKTTNYVETLIKITDENQDNPYYSELIRFNNFLDKRLDNIAEYCSAYPTEMVDYNLNKMHSVFLIEHDNCQVFNK
jgi:hypothetical protein